MTLRETAAEFDTIQVTVGNRADYVATVTIHRPEARNALNAQVREELKLTAAAIEDSDVRVVVLTGSPEGGSFVAGADVTELRDRSHLEQRKASTRPRVYETIDNLRTPVICRIHGYALGGGCELAQACDVRIAHEDAKFGQPEISLGIMPGGGATQRLPRLVGEGNAMRLILSGELIGADEAQEIGLVDQVCKTTDGLDKAVYGLAGTIAKNSPIALEFAKKAVKASSRMGLEQGIEYEAELFTNLFATDHRDKGIAAWFEDREPDWSE
jgi:enoyl-CoA hydratase